MPRRGVRVAQRGAIGAGHARRSPVLWVEEARTRGLEELRGSLSRALFRKRGATHIHFTIRGSDGGFQTSPGRGGSPPLACLTYRAVLPMRFAPFLTTSIVASRATDRQCRRHPSLVRTPLVGAAAVAERLRDHSGTSRARAGSADGTWSARRLAREQTTRELRQRELPSPPYCRASAAERDLCTRQGVGGRGHPSLSEPRESGTTLSDTHCKRGNGTEAALP